MVRRRQSTKSGGIILWKPAGITSRKALNWVERRLRARPLGHTGTLDPLASGVLVLLGGEARKFQDFLMRRRKVYVARVALGVESMSDDAEGPLYCPWPRRELPDLEEIEQALDGFRGEQMQTPPLLSAVRLDGERAYDLVRRGDDAQLKPRRVEVESIHVIAYEPPVLTLEIVCGAGYYVRSLARDLGIVLETGGFLAGLRRTELGSFRESDAVPLDSVTEDAWLSTEDLLTGVPGVEVDGRARDRLAHGQRVPIGGNRAGRAIVWSDHRVLGLAEIRSGVLYPRRWLRASE